MDYAILCDAFDLDAIDALLERPLLRYDDGGAGRRVRFAGEIVIVKVGDNFFDDGDPNHPDPELVPFKHAVCLEDEDGAAAPLAKTMFELLAKTSKALLIVNYEDIRARAPGPG